MSTTRTDAKWKNLMESPEQWPRVAELLRDFARQLEAELNEAKAALNKYSEEEILGETVRCKLQAAEADAARLAEALRNPEQISHTLEAAKQKEEALAAYESRIKSL